MWVLVAVQTCFGAAKKEQKPVQQPARRPHGGECKVCRPNARPRAALKKGRSSQECCPLRRAGAHRQPGRSRPGGGGTGRQGAPLPRRSRLSEGCAHGRTNNAAPSGHTTTHQTGPSQPAAIRLSRYNKHAPHCGAGGFRAAGNSWCAALRATAVWSGLRQRRLSIMHLVFVPCVADYNHVQQARGRS